MTTDPFTAAARALGADPSEVRESMRNALEHAERNGMPDEEFALWIWHAGAVWARGMEAARAAQEPTDAEVKAGEESIDCLFGWEHLRRYSGQSEEWMDQLRKSITHNVLSAARAARRDEEKRNG